MNGTINVANTRRDRIRITLFDAIIFALVITTTSFDDVKPLFLGMQALSFSMVILYLIGNAKTLNHLLVKYSVWLVSFVSFGLLSLLWAHSDNATALLVTLSVIQAGLIAFCIIYYCALTQKIQIVLYALVASAIVLCARFVVTVPVSMWGQEERFEAYGIFGGNGPAIVMAYAAVVLVWMCFFSKNKVKRKIPAMLCVAVFMLVSMLMGTKKSLLIFAICILIFLLGSARDPLKLGGRILLGVGAIVVAYLLITKIPALDRSIGHRFEGMFQLFLGGETDKSTASRADYFTHAFQVFLEHPLLGIGQDGYRYLNRDGTYSHNNYTEMLANLGLIGFVLYYWIYAWALKYSMRIFKRNILPLSFLLSIVIVDIAMVSYASEISYLILAMAIAAIILEFYDMRSHRTSDAPGTAESTMS